MPRKTPQIDIQSQQVDRVWFEATLKRASYTGRQISLALSNNAHWWRRVIAEERRATIGEVIALAKLLSISFDECIYRLGFRLPMLPICKVIGNVNVRGRIVTYSNSEIVETAMPPDVAPDTVAVRLAHPVRHVGNVLFYEPVKPGEVRFDILGRLAVVMTDDEPLAIVGTVEKSGTRFKIATFDPAHSVQFKALRSATPVVWQKVE